MNLDLYLFKIISALSGKIKLLDFVAVFLAKYLPFVMFGNLVVFALVQKNVYLFIVPSVVAIMARAFNQIIFVFYQRKRPFEALGLKPLTEKPKYPAFPSSHSAFFFGLSFAILLFDYQLALVYLVLSFFVVFARIYCRLHWPSDILAGFFMGFFSFLLASSI